jgi:hypothetical protein
LTVNLKNDDNGNWQQQEVAGTSGSSETLSIGGGIDSHNVYHYVGAAGIMATIAVDADILVNSPPT